jgi:hypothetical protein
MDELEDFHAQVKIDDGGWEELGEPMNFLLDWNKRRKRKKRLKALIQDSIKVGICRGTSGEQLDYYVDCRPLIANSSK